MITYPLSFHGNASASPGMKATWHAQSSEQQTMCCVPAEFEGITGHYSPEDFFLQALQNCFVATFKVYAEHSKLSFQSINVKTELVVDKSDLGQPMMKRLIMNIHLEAASDVNRGRSLIKKALVSGFILQSVKTEIISEIEVS